MIPPASPLTLAMLFGAAFLAGVVNSIAGAYAERSPVVVIAGAPGARERAGGYLLHHQVRTVDTQFAVFREFTCDQAVLTDAATAPAEIARVLRNALEMSLPVYIEFPRDMVDAPVEPVPRLPRRAADPEALAECADEVLARYDAAIQLGETAAEARVRKAWFLHRLGSDNEALDLLETPAAAGSSDAFLDYLRQFFRGQVLESLGRRDDAVSTYRAALDLAPAAPIERHGRGADLAGGRVEGDAHHLEVDHVAILVHPGRVRLEVGGLDPVAGDGVGHPLEHLIGGVGRCGTGGRDTALIYLSDHGESLGENGLYLHGVPYAIAPETQTRVPMVMWLSPGFARSRGVDLTCLRREGEQAPASQDNLFHSVLGLMQVSTPEYDARLDLFRACTPAATG